MLTNKCHHCDRTFSKLQHLKRHRRAHTGERPFKCTFCGKQFARRDVLLRHSRAHGTGHVGSNAEPMIPSLEDETQQPSGNPVGKQAPGTSLQVPSTKRHAEPSPISGQGDSTRTSSQDIESMPAGIIDNDETNNSNAAPSSVITGAHEPCLVSKGGLSGSVMQEQMSGERDQSNDEISELIAFHDFSGSLEIPDLLSCEVSARTSHDTRCWPSTLRSDTTASRPDGTTIPANLPQAWFGCSNPHQPAGDSMFDIPNMLGELDWARPTSNFPAPKRIDTRQSWPSRPPRSPPLMPTLWNDVALCTNGNILSQTAGAGGDYRNGLGQLPNPHSATGLFQMLGPLTRGLWGPCSACNMDRHAVSYGAGENDDWTCPDPPSLQRVSICCQKCEATFELLALGFEQYKRKFHAIIPVVHIPTFSLEEAPPLLLLVMCLLGLSLVIMEKATTLVSESLPGLLEKVYAEVVTTTFGDATPKRRLSVFATATLTLALVILTGGNPCTVQARLLYVNTLTAARQHLLFSANFQGPFDCVIPQSTGEQHDQWMSWGRIESTKRIIVSLVLADTWFSEYFSTGPIVPTEDIRLFLPCDTKLFEAPSASEWAKLKQNGSSSCDVRFSLSSTDSDFPSLQKPVHQYTMKAILCSILLRIYDSYHRLFPGIEEATLLRNRYIPWKTFALSDRAQANTGSVLQIMQLYDLIMEDDASDCIVLWHQMGILLTTDCGLLEEAAGREGAEVANKAMPKIKVWARTAAARRACLHAAQSFKFASRRRTLDGGSFQSPNHLFNAALVLGFYLLICPPGTKGQVTCGKELELLGDADWTLIGNQGLVEMETGRVSSTENEFVNFIRFGGPVSLGNEPCSGGVRSAQKALLDYASLLDNMKKWNIGDYSRLLYELSSSLGHLQTMVDEPL